MSSKGTRKGFILYSDDQDCLAWYRNRYGIETDSQAIRLALRLWRDVIEAGLVTEKADRLQKTIQQSKQSHTSKGWRKAHRRYNP